MPLQYKQAASLLAKANCHCRWMNQDEAHTVKTMRQIVDVMPASADMNTLKPKYNNIQYAGVVGAWFSLSSMLSGQSSGQRWAQPSSHGVFNPWFG